MSTDANENNNKNYYLCHIQAAKQRRVEVFWRTEQKRTCKVMEVWIRAAADQLLPLESPAQSASAPASLSLASLNPVLEGREPTVSGFDKLSFVSVFVANLSMLLFLILKMNNFAKDYQNPKTVISFETGNYSPQWALSTQQRLGSSFQLEENPENARNLWCCSWIRCWQDRLHEVSTFDSLWRLKNMKPVTLIPTTDTGFMLIFNSTQQFCGGILFCFSLHFKVCREKNLVTARSR